MGRFNDFVNMVKERRVGFLMDEVMSGEHEFEPGFGPAGKRPMEFRVTWGPRELGKWINPLGDGFMTQNLEGAVTVDGLATNAACKGTLELLYHQGIIRYTFDFGAGGKDYHYVGEKMNIRPWNLHKTHTTCYGKVTDASTGEVVSKSITHFTLKAALPFILSMRLA